MKPLEEALRDAGRALFDAQSPKVTAQDIADPPAWDTWDDIGPACQADYVADAMQILRSLAESGWELKPREATECMQTAGKLAAVTTYRVDKVYDAMFAAAPKVTP